MAKFVYKTGDMFEESSWTQLIIPVNCVGVMGAGIAKVVKDKYPKAFNEYKDFWEGGRCY